METHGSVVKRSLAVLRRRFATLWVAAAWPHIVLAVCCMAIAAFHHLREQTGEHANPATLWQSMGGWAKLGVLAIFVVATALPHGLAVGGVTSVIWKDFETGAASLRDALTGIGGHPGRLILLSLGLGAFAEIGSVIVIPTVLVIVFCAFAVPVLIIEKTGTFRSVQRSFALSGQKIGSILGLRFATFLFLFLVLIAMSTLIRALPDTDMQWWVIPLGFWTILVLFASLAQMVEAIVVTQLYIDIQGGKSPGADPAVS